MDLLRHSPLTFSGFHHGVSRYLREQFEIRILRDGAESRLPNPFYRYLADPFIASQKNELALFVEDFEFSRNRGRISALELDSSLQPGRMRPVLSGPDHLSYPFLFNDGSSLYMLPESSRSRQLNLFYCKKFPFEWAFSQTLIDSIVAIDTNLIQHDGMYFLLGLMQRPGQERVTLQILFSEKLTATVWYEHPFNKEAVAHNIYIRNAGSIFTDQGALIWPTQNNVDYYGQSIRYREITSLSPQTFTFRDHIVKNAELHTIGKQSHHISRLNDMIVFDVRTRYRRSKFTG